MQRSDALRSGGDDCARQLLTVTVATKKKRGVVAASFCARVMETKLIKLESDLAGYYHM